MSNMTVFEDTGNSNFTVSMVPNYLTKVEKTKLYSVKGFTYDSRIDSKYKTGIKKQRLVVFGKNLTYSQAKKMVQEKKDFKASIFPNVLDQFEKITTVGDLLK